MQTKTNNKPNGTTVPSKSFKSILNEMMKLTKGGNLRVANSSWDIHAKPAVNNSNYNNPIGA